ncbi:MAG: hypothetical protein HYV27_24745 [Candidatus Hydrogenedentes bacterium]|nr:hypothetical protein [Candidatus Hydrogenedentota bacterium]
MADTASQRGLSLCKCLRSKEMYHERYGKAEDACSSGVYWCNKTYDNFGPDGGEVSQEECFPGRECFKL